MLQRRRQASEMLQPGVGLHILHLGEWLERLPLLPLRLVRLQEALCLQCPSLEMSGIDSLERFVPARNRRHYNS
jgi:hypothetical protein